MAAAVDDSCSGERVPSHRVPFHRPDADVRMRGFVNRATVEAAVAWIDGAGRAPAERPVEQIPLRSAAGRVLAQDVISEINVPGFARSMMDGFAIRSEESWGATTYNPTALEIVGEALPGRPFGARLSPGQAVRIMTGASLPDGADSVMPVEYTEVRGDRVLVGGEVTAGKHVGQIGEDIQAGDRILASGRVLRPQDAGLLSSIGISHVAVVRRPRIRIVVTGSELLPAGSRPVGSRIADANGPMLEALVMRDGGDVVAADLVPDDPELLLAALRQPADVILVSGGTSVGQEDHLPVILAEHGELAIHGIAMRPSSPAGMGRIGETLVFLLPGNPVSCLCAYDFFAGRAIRALGGRSVDWPYRAIRAVLSRKLVSQVGRVDYARVQLTAVGIAEPLAIGGAAVLSSTTRADGFVVIAADSEGYPEGAEVSVMLY